MSTSAVWRVLFLFAPLALTAAVVAASYERAHGQQREPDLEMGARLVEARCVFCHQEKSLPDLVDRCSREHGSEYLDEFLKDHHAPDDDARQDIIAYLTCPPHLLPPK
ncbi:MAG: hypothetical protein OEN23_02500 [Paracoccaceae bacterium]|nr:hypothetical protein [Paracoccaceae bacterium]